MLPHNAQIAEIRSKVSLLLLFNETIEKNFRQQ